jgi:hypothetical protein
MHKVELRMLMSGPFRIEAESFVNGNPDQRKGNVDTLNGRRFQWTAQSDPTLLRYVVTFRRLSDGLTVWPFRENADGTGTAPANYVGPLTLTPGAAVSLTTKKIDWPVKYEVTATRSDGDNVDVLDPVIIIRPARNLEMDVALGVTCAVIGAIAGATATWAMS